ncbi:hypothetical protein IscW_ISCW008664 [Ixodes scapularis]|uniref:Uncharacterized protein n=1 Tax=Ixodes scapularis TaxID=6945 RepID=B7Q3C3_IXOSC|nr:hypothetical protein IscW_ISCW008664 [Ixodes scapularis]|eukprot:XP_002411221.1 hypothetical protein IscW_ISCW008664 [Ixodes scapularis]
MENHVPGTVLAILISMVVSALLIIILLSYLYLKEFGEAPGRGCRGSNCNSTTEYGNHTHHM